MRDEPGVLWAREANGREVQCPERATTPMLPHAVALLQPALQLKGSGSVSQQQSSRIPKGHWLSKWKAMLVLKQEQCCSYPKWGEGTRRLAMLGNDTDT